MQVNIIEKEKKIPLWEFFKKNLPDSFCTFETNIYYGKVYGLKIKIGNTLSSRIRFGSGIANIFDDEVTLNDPKYYSDFEKIILDYERLTNKNVKFNVWE